jgi:hypothetical protein
MHGLSPNENVKRAFQVVYRDKAYTTQKVKRVDGAFIYEDVEAKGYWMVYFPQGHSIRITKESELKRLGFDGTPDLVDMKEGEVVGKMPDYDIRPKRGKNRVKQADDEAVEDDGED